MGWVAKSFFLFAVLTASLLSTALAQESAYDKYNSKQQPQNSTGSEVPLPSAVGGPAMPADPHAATPSSSAAQMPPPGDGSSANPGANSTPTNPPAPPNPASAANNSPEIPDIKIGPGDLLDISVFNVPDLSAKTRVSSHGDIVMPLIGTVHVANQTADEVETTLGHMLSDGGYVNNPQVTVMISEYASQGVSILGEVQKPGVYPLLAPRRLWDVLSMAGGLTQRAGKDVSIAHRDSNQKPQIVPISNDSADLRGNVPIYPGDTIAVSRAGVVYVVGDVARPSGFVMDNGGNMTVLQALAMAQGANGTAALSKALLIRQGPSGRSEEPVNLKLMLEAKAPDVSLRPEDILFVPKSTAKSAGKRTLDAIVQTAVGVAIYHPFY